MVRGKVMQTVVYIPLDDATDGIRFERILFDFKFNTLNAVLVTGDRLFKLTFL